jgi:hypothetical protein
MKKAGLILVFCLGVLASYSQNRRFNLPNQAVDSTAQTGTDSLSENQTQNKPKQTEQKTKPAKEGFWKRTFTGGGFGLSFGNITNINLSPQFGYRVTDNFWAGVGVTYIYFSERYPGYPKFTTNIYGGRVFLRYIVWKGIFVHAENEMLNLQRYDDLDKRIWVNSLMAGAGYQQSLGGNSSIYLMALFNFTESQYTPYINPIVRFGFNIGL